MVSGSVPAQNINARAPFMHSHYICIMVAFESLHGLIETMNTSVMRTQLQKRSHITALVLSWV